MRKIPNLTYLDRTGLTDDEVATRMLTGLFPSI
jgi:hypothetical protein